jgi:hypothetical protein
VKRSLAACSAVAVFLAGSAGGFGRGARAEDGATSRTFAELNFRWTLPSADWVFEDPTDEQKKSMHVVNARRDLSANDVVETWVRIDPDTKAFSLDVMVARVKEAKEKSFASVQQSQVEPATVGGAAGSQVTVVGSYREGPPVLARVWCALVGGKFYRLDVHAYGASDRKIGDEIRTLVAGFTFLEIPKEQPAAASTEAGPSRAFPALDLTWTLPAGGGNRPKWSFTDAGKADLGRKDAGLLAAVEMLAPDGTQTVDADLSIRPLAAGETLEAAAEKAKAAPPVSDSFAPAATPEVAPSAAFGNHYAALLRAAGVSKDKAKKAPKAALEIRSYVGVLKGVVYQMNVFLRQGAPQAHDADVKALVDGLRWGEAFVAVPGPMAWPFSPYTEPRGDHADKEMQIKITKAHGFTIVKPAGWGLWKIEGAEPKFQFHKHQVWWFAAEARKGGAYCTFAVITYPVKDLIAQKPPKQETAFIDEFEKSWKERFPDAVTRPKSKELNRDDGAWKEGKGWTYEFRGSAGGVPYLERGWLVRFPQYAYWIRAQYGGKDAEAAFADGVEALRKGFSYEK